jgi:hypothetical protein
VSNQISASQCSIEKKRIDPTIEMSAAPDMRGSALLARGFRLTFSEWISAIFPVFLEPLAVARGTYEECWFAFFDGAAR